MRPVFEQVEKLSIGKVSLWAHSELECVNLEVRFTLTRLDIVNLTLIALIIIVDSPYILNLKKILLN